MSNASEESQAAVEDHETPGPPPRRAPWSRRDKVATWVVCGVLAVAALVLLGKHFTSDDAETTAASPTITGSLTLVDDITNWSIARGDFCTGLDGYGDIEAGAQVTVKNEDGRILGIGNLGPGTIVEVDQEAERFRCQFRFTVADVDNARFYSVEVGRRGEITHSRDELELRGWTVDLTLGE